MQDALLPSVDWLRQPSCMLLRAAPFAKRAMLSSKRPPPLQQGIVVFPDVLHHVLTVLEQDNQSHIASWLPHGRSFKVHDRKAFVETILPCWFRQQSFASFQRQLNIYGFTRVTSGTDADSYHHENFLRGHPALVRGMKRMAVKGLGPRQAALASHQPNFYTMAPLPTSQEANEPRATLVANGVPPIATTNTTTESVSLSVPSDLESMLGVRGNATRDLLAEATLPGSSASGLLEPFGRREREAAHDQNQRQQPDPYALRPMATSLSIVYPPTRVALPPLSPSRFVTGLRPSTTEMIQGSGIPDTMSTLQLLQLHRLANNNSLATEALFQQPQQGISAPLQTATASNLLQAALQEQQRQRRQQLDMTERVSLAQAAMALARSRATSNEMNNTLDVAMLMQEQATAAQYVQSSLFNQQRRPTQLQLEHHDGASYSSNLLSNDLESILRPGVPMSASSRITINPLVNLAPLVESHSRAALLQRLLNNRAGAVRQSHGSTFLGAATCLGTSANVGGSGGGEPLVPMVAGVFPFLGREGRSTSNSATILGTDRDLQPFNQVHAAADDGERKPKARRPVKFNS